MSFPALRSKRFNNVLATTSPATVPTVTTQAATGVGSTTATGNGTLVSTGGAAITAMGFVWATHANPTLSDNVVTDPGTGVGSFSDTLTGLPSNTQIFVDAYATNSVGTSYGGDQTFTTTAPAFGVTLALLGVG